MLHFGDLWFASVDDGKSDDTMHLAGPNMNQDLSTWGDFFKKFDPIYLQRNVENMLITDSSRISWGSSQTTSQLSAILAPVTLLVTGAWFVHAYIHDDAALIVGVNVTVDSE